MFNISKKALFTISLAIFSFLLYIGVIEWGIYLTKNMVECFTVDRGTSSTTHTVNLPINTTFSCQNMCGPLARCSKTGEQCSSDIDCPGCKPPVSQELLKDLSVNIPAYNDSGKLTTEATPNFSVLTSDFGSRAETYRENSTFLKVPTYNIGYNTWRKTYDKGTTLFNSRNSLSPNEIEEAPHYPKRKTLSGEFLDDGPLPANAEL